MPSADKTKIGLISLGCPKNLVDSEVMLGLLKNDGYELTQSQEDADVMIVNTCAFIDPSKKESVDTILDVARLKEEGKLKKLIVTGCLSQRYSKELKKEMPEVDHFLGTGEFQKISEFVQIEEKDVPDRVKVSRPEYVYDYATPRISTLPPHTAYVKIAEGCSRTCSFCIIPRLRGRARSRDIESIVLEAEKLADSGALELNLIAQDLTAYGHDRDDGANLEKLLEKLIDVKGIEWIRLMYNYPMYFSDHLIDLISGSKKICKYLDIPLQHIDSELLASMQRKVDEKATYDLLKKLRKNISGLNLRTTMIVGFPGETDAQFQKLLHFIQDVEFDCLGVFTYSQEENTVAATLPGQLPEKVKKKRRDEIMKVQQAISKRRNGENIGRKVRVLVDQELPEPNGYTHQARTEGQALDIDGQVYLRGSGIEKGKFMNVELHGASEYDLFADTL